jgi:Flp pilus assembly secretin CpaC
MIFVAANTPEKRRQFAVQAEQAFLLPASVGPEDMTELLRILREITVTNHIALDVRSRTITMRDSLEKLALADELIRQVETARGEIMLEFELLEIDRNNSQQLGITPPSSARAFFINPYDIRRVQQAKDLTNALTILTQIFSSQGLSLNTPLALVGGGYTTFLLALPGAAAADFSSALSLVKSGRQVLLRAQDSKPANFFVGDRYPVSLSLLSGGADTGGSIGPSLQIPTSPTFPQTSFSVGNNPVALTAGNFSAGALPDLAVVNRDDSTISILLNQGGGKFVAHSQSPFMLPKTETGPVAIASGIFGNTITNSSGVTIVPIDLAVANSTSNNVTVLFGNGEGGFQAAAGSPYKVGANPSAIVVADFDGDGRLDFAVANKADSSISVFKGDGKGGFTQFSNSPFLLPATEKGPVALLAANFRNRTLRSGAETALAVVNQTTNNVSILLPSVDAQGNLSFSEAPNSPIRVGQSPVAIATGDFNRDAVLDLAVVNQGDNSISILLGSTNADGSFSPALGSPLSTAASPAGIVTGKFSGDTQSLAVTNKGQGTLSIYVGQGTGTFSSPLEIALPTSPGAIITATFTNSGLPDVALTALGSTSGQGVVTVVQNSPAFSGSGGIGVRQVPYPSAEFVDLGVKVKATPSLHANREVTLQLEFEIRALAGTSVNGIPVLTNRTLTQTVRLKEDETSLIGGLLNDEETRAISGLPGLAKVPGAGYAFGKRSTSLKDTEFVILITPRRLRSPFRSGASIFAGRGDPGGTVGAAPFPGRAPGERPEPPQQPPLQPGPEQPLQPNPQPGPPPQPQPPQPPQQPPPQP